MPVKKFSTGDIGRQTKYGIQILGRHDSIVKINGKRVSLKEIEHEIAKMKYVRQCCVIAYQKNKSKNKKTLCCLYSAEHKIKKDYFIKKLKEYLFDYMIPSHFIHTEQFPRTLRGKVIKSKAEDIIYRYFSNNEKLTVKQNFKNNSELTVKALCVQIQQILNLGEKTVNSDTNLKSIGLDSISVLKLLTYFSDNNIDVTHADIIDCKTPNEIVAKIGLSLKHDNNKNNYQIRLKKTTESMYPITDTGQIQYELNNSLGIATRLFHLFNVAGTLKITKHTLQEIKTAAEKLFELHPILKTSIKEVDGEPYYYNPQDFKYPIDIVELKSEPTRRTFVKQLQKFNLQTDSLCHATIFIYKKDIYLMFDVHHLAADGFSVAVIVENFCRLIKNLPPKKEQFSAFDVAYAQKYSLSENENKKIVDFYESKYNGYHLTQLPHKHFGFRHLLPFDNKVDKKINAEPIDNYCCNNGFSDCKVFFAMFIYALHVATGETKLAVPTLDSGRVCSGMINTAGCFFSAYPVICDFDKNKNSFEYLVNEVINAELDYYKYPFSYRNFKDYYLNNKTTFNYVKNYSHFYKVCSPYEFAPEVEIHPIDLSLFATSPLMFHVKEKSNGKYLISFTYNTNIYTKKDIKEFADIFLNCYKEIFGIDAI